MSTFVELIDTYSFCFNGGFTLPNSQTAGAEWFASTPDVQVINVHGRRFLSTCNIEDQNSERIMNAIEQVCN